jgi:Protein of unknown function (DUF1565)
MIPKNGSYGFFILILTLAFIGAFCAPVALASTIYVDVDNTGEEDGSAAHPYNTIAEAAAVAKAGDTVQVAKGTYYERNIRPANSGSPGKPITFKGKRGEKGEWLTIIDGSRTTEYKWTLDEKLSNAADDNIKVYKTTAIPSEIRGMICDDKLLGRMHNSIMNGKRTTRGFAKSMKWDDLLSAPLDAKAKGQNKSIGRFWDATYGLCGYRKEDGARTVYIRFRKGDNPDDHKLRYMTMGSVINVSARNYITFQDLSIRGGEYGVTVTNSTGAVIDSCELRRISAHKIRLRKSTSCTVKDSHALMDYFGYENCGAHNGAPRNPATKDMTHFNTRSLMYKLYKVIIHSEDGNPPAFIHCPLGKDYTVSGNTLDDGYMGITLIGVDGAKIYDNLLSGLVSAAIMVHDSGKNTVADIYNNRITDVDIAMRLGNMNQGAGDTTVRFYRNRVWLPYHVGLHIFQHLSPTKDYDEGAREIWIYNNSFQGGEGGISFSIHMDKRAPAGFPKQYIINNVISAKKSIVVHSLSPNFRSNANGLGACDYNWLGGADLGYTPAWLGKNNVMKTGQDLWKDSLTASPDFPTLPANCGALDAALNISQPFTIGKTQYKALPDTVKSYSGKPDIGAVEMKAARNQ